MNYRNQEIKVLSYRILLVFLFYTSFRLLFIYFNNDILKLTSFGNILELCYYGLRFDSVAIVYSNLIFLLLSILPLTQITSNGYQKFLFGVYFIFNGIGMMINFIDLEYYRFNLNRMMSSVFEVVKFETNKTTLFFHFLYTHFHLLLIYMFLFVLWIWLYNKIVIDPNKIVKIRNYIISSVLFFLTVSTLAVMGVRGGDLKKSTRPITLIDAMDHVDNPLHADVVLNSLFTIIRTLNQEDFKIRDQFNEDELTEVLNPIKSYNRDWDTKPNVVIFILESMGREYWGSMNQKTQIPNYISYTPFLDSLAQHSLIYPNAFATSRKSIHGMPSVLAGIPSFKLSYASSSYAKQKIQSVVSLANELDYETSFFHGAAKARWAFRVFRIPWALTSIMDVMNLMMIANLMAIGAFGMSPSCSL